MWNHREGLDGKAALSDARLTGLTCWSQLRGRECEVAAGSGAQPELCLILSVVKWEE